MLHIAQKVSILSLFKKNKKRLQLTPLCQLDRGVFYSDANANPSFVNVMFYGNESSLFGLEIMVFVLIAGCWGNYLVGMLAVGAMSRVSLNSIEH